MNKTLIIGIVALVLGFSVMIIGGLFKLMHWPGSSVMLCIGMILELAGVFTLILSLVTTVKTKQLIGIITLALGFSILLIGALFELMHWQGNTVMLGTGLVLELAAVILLFSAKTSAKNPTAIPPMQ